MLSINPVGNFCAFAKVKSTRNNKTVFKGNSVSDPHLSKKSIDIIDRAYNILVEGEKKLAEARVVEDSFDISFDNPRSNPVSMTKYDRVNQTLIRMKRAFAENTLTINLDNFKLQERLGFDVLMKDKTYGDSKRGDLSKFYWTKNGKAREYNENEIDRIIEKYFG